MGIEKSLQKRLVEQVGVTLGHPTDYKKEKYFLPSFPFDVNDDDCEISHLYQLSH